MQEVEERMEQLPMDADTDDCMDAKGRATQDAKAERTGTYLQRVINRGYPSPSHSLSRARPTELTP